jgi:hypothetical protein
MEYVIASKGIARRLYQDYSFIYVLLIALSQIHQGFNIHGK